MSLPPGKIEPRLLEDLLSRYRTPDASVVIGPRIGEDAAAIDLGDRYLLLTTDPITFTHDRIGWYAVHVNANDIAAMGGTPRYFLSTLLLPERQANESMVERIFAEISETCRELGCSMVGGHTEVTQGLDRPIVAGAMVGEVARDRLVTSSGALPGDMLIQARGIAIEATAILAREKAREIAGRFGTDFQERSAGFLTKPGLSVVAASRAACSTGEIHAMHDPTEGGIANALWELAEASRVGILVVESEIPRYWESAVLAEHFAFELLGAISSGTLLMTAAEPGTTRVLEALADAGIEAHVIGRVLGADQGVKMLRGRQRIDLPRFDADELTRIL